MAACKGPGKSCVLAWLAWNFLVTRLDAKVVATSISGDNLRDGLWAEMAKWQQKSPLLKKMFIYQKERIMHREHPETWWMSARNWSKSADPNALGMTLAGFHADNVMAILDESGGIPDAIMTSAEAVLSSAKDGKILQAGNPTHLEGPLYRAVVTETNKWYVVRITSDPDDPKRTPRVTKKWAQEQIDMYGKDNPWVLVNVFGRFPPSSFNALIGPEELADSTKRRYREPDFDRHALILGVDVARYGADSSIIFPRQGLQAFTPFQYRNLDSNQGAETVLRKWNDTDADAVFIDNTGGFGAGWIDNLTRLGKAPIGIHFSQKSTSAKYYNKRAEMAFACVEWIRGGGALPNCDELTKALAGMTYTFKGDQLLIEPKEELKTRLGFSPDHMDALFLTFAMPIEKANKNPVFSGRSNHSFDYDPLARDYILG